MEPQLDEIFSELGISHYLETFIEQGFDTWETILDITESDLDALGVKLGHRRKLQRRIANSRGIAPDVALGSPTSTRISLEERFEPPRPEGIKTVSEAKDASVTKRKYRRHPKADENAPERPPSAYVLFSNKMREDLKGRNLTFTEIAKLVGENWQSLTPSEKEPFERQAQQTKEKYNNELANYKKTPEYRQYNQYLQDFKIKHSSCHRQDKDSLKRPRLETSMQATLQSGSASSSTTLGGSNHGNISGTTSGDSQQGSEPPPSSHHALPIQDPSSVSTTPLSFHRNMDDALTSPNAHGGGFFEPMDQSPKPYPQDSTHHGHRSRISTSWKPSESGSHYLPSLSDVFDGRQPFAQTPEGTSYSSLMKTHHRSGPGPPSDPRPPSVPISLRKEHCSAGSMSSGLGSTSGSNSISGSSGPSSSYSSFTCNASEASLPLPVHALLASKTSSRFESGSTPSSKLPTSDFPLYLHRQSTNRSTNAMSPGGLDFGNGLQSPMSGFQRDVRTEDKQGENEDSNMDGMSALLRAGEIVGRRAR